MKKLFTLLLLLVSMLSLHAEIRTGKCGNNVTFTLDTETGAMSIEGTGAMSNYSYSALFDSSLNGIGVNLTTAPWRYYYKSLTSVTISEGVTNIGNYAFFQCSSLTSVNIPSSVTSIGSSAFFN